MRQLWVGIKPPRGYVFVVQDVVDEYVLERIASLASTSSLAWKASLSRKGENLLPGNRSLESTSTREWTAMVSEVVTEGDLSEENRVKTVWAKARRTKVQGQRAR